MDKAETVDNILNIAKQFVGYFEEVEEKVKIEYLNLNTKGFKGEEYEDKSEHTSIINDKFIKQSR